MTTILISKDLEKFNVSTEIAKYSKLIDSMLETLSDEDNIEVPLLNVESNILKYIITYLEYYSVSPHGDIDKPIRSDDMKDNVSDEWYANFIDKSQEDIFNIILAANYMDIQSLLDLSCAKIATLIKGKSPEEIREVFNIQDDNI